MKKYILPLLLLAAPAFAAQQEITAVPDSPVLPSIGALKDAINLRLADIDENFDEIYPIIEAGPVYVNASAPADTKVVWIDTDQDNAIKVYVGGVWTVVGSGGDGSSTTVGDGTTGPYLDGTVDGGTLIKLSAPSGGNGTWTSLQGGNPTANRNWRLPIDAPPAAGETLVMTMDEYGQMDFLAAPETSGYVLSSTDAGVLSWVAGGSSGDDLGSAAYSDVVALWTTCTGYLKSDGTCDTPSGSATYPSAAGVANWDGSAWGTSYTVGTGASNLVQLNGSAQLPAVSGALLTGSFSGTLIGMQNTLSGAIQTIGTELDGQDELLFDSDDFTETDGTGTVTVSIDKSAVEATQPSTLALTTDTSITEADLLSSKYLSNYGASGEVDIILPAISYNQTRTILIEAAHVLEISPPSGEVLELSGTDLTADYCVNSGSVVGNKATATRLRTGASTWKWSIDVVRGTWASCGAASD